MNPEFSQGRRSIPLRDRTDMPHLFHGSFVSQALHIQQEKLSDLLQEKFFVERAAG